MLALAAPAEREALAERLAAARPDMPAIAAAVREAIAEKDVKAVIRRADAERRRVARSAARSLHRKRVATLGNSALVARALVYGSPAVTQIVAADPDDEGLMLASDLRAAGLAVEVLSLDRVDADIAVVGCEAVYDDGSFIARRGTRDLVERMPALVLVDRWKKMDSPPPADAPAGRYELVPGDVVRAPA